MPSNFKITIKVEKVICKKKPQNQYIATQNLIKDKNVHPIMIYLLF